MQTKTDNTLRNVEIGGINKYLNLSVFPISGQNNATCNFSLLGPALEKNQADIEEVSDEGSVPNIYIDNKIYYPILIIDGETLTGEKLKQNRIAVVSILIPGMQKTLVNVLCSEQGRWSRTNRRFASMDSSMFAKARFAKMERMQENMRGNSSENYHEAADQNQAWEQINRKFQAFDAYSESESMQDIYETKEKKMQEYLDNLKMPENALGAVFAIGANVMGFELFSNTNTFRSLYPKLLKSYALDAIENKVRDNSEPSITDAKKMIEMADSSVAKQCKNQGLGQLFTINNDDLCATVLMLDGVIVHFTCFSKNMQGEL